MSNDPSTALRRRWRWPAVLGGLSALALLPLLGFGFTFDQGVFSTQADTMLRGGMLYRDAWEHKPPGVYYVYYLAFLLIQREIWAVRLLEIVALAVSSAGLFRLVERRCGSWMSGAISAAALPLTYLAFGQNSAQAESFQIPFLIGALLLLPEAGEPRANLRNFGAGLLLGAGVMFKTPLVLLAPFMVLERLWLDRREPGLPGKLRGALLLGSGVPVALLVVAGAYGLRGAGPELYDALITYPAGYAAVSLTRSDAAPLREGLGWIGWLVPSSALAQLLIGVCRSGTLRGSQTLRWALYFIGSWSVVAVQGRFFPYHHLPMLPAIAWGLGLLYASAPSSEEVAFRPNLKNWVHVVGFALAGAMLVQYFHLILDKRPTLGRLARFDADNGVPDGRGIWEGQRAAAEYLRTRTDPEDRVLLWGDEPLVYPMSQRRMAGRNSHLMQVVPVWGGSERLLPFIERLKRTPPRLILVCPDKLWWRHDQTPKALLREYPEMQAFLDSGYRYSDGFRGYEVWTRKEDP